MAALQGKCGEPDVEYRILEDGRTRKRLV